MNLNLNETLEALFKPLPTEGDAGRLFQALQQYYLDKYDGSSFTLEDLLKVIRSGRNLINDSMGRVKAADKTRYEAILVGHLKNVAGARKPEGFASLTPQVAGMARFVDNEPDCWACGLWLYQKGMRTVISIEQNGAARTKEIIESFPDMEWYSCFLKDWHAPSAEHLQAYVSKVKERSKAGAVVTHCWGGTGRTGCFLGAYLVSLSYKANADVAFPKVRQKYNVRSVEMKAQYNALARFADSLGRPASLPAGDKKLNHAKRHWDKDHAEDGLHEDPGHEGDPKEVKGNINKKMISSSGAADSKKPSIERRKSSEEPSTDCNSSI